MATVGNLTLKAGNEALRGEMPKLWKEATSSKSCLAPGVSGKGIYICIYIYVYIYVYVHNIVK